MQNNVKTIFFVYIFVKAKPLTKYIMKTITSFTCCLSGKFKEVQSFQLEL